MDPTPGWREPIAKSDREIIARLHMIDKQRHRHVRAPHGYLPNWVLFVLATGAMALTVLAQSIG
jgi:hypothetical protein